MGWLTSITPTIAGAVAFVDVAAKTALVLLGALAATRLLRRSSASTRHRVWTVALTCVLALPALSALLPAWQVPILPAAGLQGLATAVPGDTGNAALGSVPSLPAVAPAAAPVSRNVARGSAPAASDQPTGAETATSAVAASSLFQARSLLTALVIAWFGGSAILLARVFSSSLAASFVARRAKPVTDVVVRREALAVARGLGIRCGVRLVTSRRISMPMAWGVLRPTVLLPAGCERWTEARRRVVLLHEMAHLKRRDCQTLLLARVVTALYWFNPLVWVAARRLQAERERACDDLVLSAGTRAPDYAHHLLDIARTVRGSVAPNVAAVAMARPRELEGRLLAILDPDANRGGAPRLTTLAVMLAGVLLVFPLAVLQPRAQADQGPENNPPEGAQEVGEQLVLRLDYELEQRVKVRLAERAALRLEIDVDAESLAEGLNVEGVGFSRTEQDVDPRVLDAFLTALRDEDPEIRADAARSLGHLESPEAVPALAGALEGDGDAGVREQVAWALGMIEDDSGVPALTTALVDADGDVREQAAWALGMIESDEAVSALTGAAADTEEQVREQIAWALGMIESAAAVDTLSAMLRGDSSAQVREQAAWALGMIEDETALDALLDALTDEDPDVRRQALWAVAQVSG